MTAPRRYMPSMLRTAFIGIAELPLVDDAHARTFQGGAEIAGNAEHARLEAAFDEAHVMLAAGGGERASVRPACRGECP